MLLPGRDVLYPLIPIRKVSFGLLVAFIADALPLVLIC